MSSISMPRPRRGSDCFDGILDGNVTRLLVAHARAGLQRQHQQVPPALLATPGIAVLRAVGLHVELAILLGKLEAAAGDWD